MMSRRPAHGWSSLTQLFSEMCARRSGHPALLCGSERLTYGEWESRSRGLAAELVRRGVAPGDLVGLQVARTIEAPIGLLAILLAGAAYVPLDPGYPAAQLRRIVEETGIRCVVGDPGADLGGSLNDRVAVGDWGRCTGIGLPEPTPQDAAYVIHTSGSTGRSKGCVVTHANLLSLLDAALPLFNVGEQDRWTLFHSVNFDFSVWELWGAIATGGTVVVVDGDSALDPSLFLELLARERVTVLNQVPSYFRTLVEAHADAGTPPLHLRYLIFGGEPVDLQATVSFLDALPSQQQPIAVNMYGITETTVHVTYKELDRATLAGSVRSPIGNPLAHLQVVLQDSTGAEVPAGEVGEMWVSGAGVARGYLGRPDLTAARFTMLGGMRSYRSGDLARRLPNGELEYLGRTDHQVKLRGFRIEPAEIESVLRRCAGVGDAVVDLRTDDRIGDFLIAYVVLDCPLDARRLRAECSAQLPAQLVPTRYEQLSAIPLTPAGKVDRAALAARPVVSGNWFP